MGWLDFFRSKQTPEYFAQLFIAQAKQIGVTHQMSFEPHEFRLKITTQTGETQYFHLENARRDYQAADKKEKNKVLSAYAQSLNIPEIPASFAQAKPYLMPIIRSAMQNEFVYLSNLVNSGQAQRNCGFQALGQDAHISLAYDTEHTLISVSDEQLKTWGVTFADALPIALDNLRDQTAKSMVQLDNQVWLSDWHDAFDSSRILLSDLMYRTLNGGEPVMMIPTRGRLLLTHINNVAAQMSMLELARSLAEQEGRSISTEMFCYVDGQLRTYVPQDEPLRHALNQFKQQALSEDYDQQKDLLDAAHEAQNRDIFVGSYSLYQNSETGHVFSSCAWTQDVVSLLPQTDRVLLVFLDKAQNMPDMLCFEWPVLQQAIGHLLQEQECFPPRYLVSTFPARELLNSLPQVQL
ncbi:MAG: hypothetical protein ACRCV6_05730 [Formosimonas sp.]